jgi:hypothetical protein
MLQFRADGYGFFVRRSHGKSRANFSEIRAKMQRDAHDAVIFIAAANENQKSLSRKVGPQSGRYLKANEGNTAFGLLNR